MSEDVTKPTQAEVGEGIRPESKIGLSLSFCVSDILRGRVQEEELKEIISATKVEKPEEWNDLIEDYKKYYWYEDPEKAERICRRLIDTGKIRQPRTEGKEAHNISAGHWLEADQVENWEKQQGWK